MDINFTGQMWGVPISLIGQITNESIIKFTDWLPILVVVVGGLITFFVTSTIEESKRHYELKKQVYFEFIDQITKTRSLIIELRKIDQLPPGLDRDIALRNQFARVNEMDPQFDAAKLKVQVCGSDEIGDLIKDWTLTAVSTQPHSARFDDISNAVCDAMRRELTKPKLCRWQFWK
jgi:hypothetical protein